MRTFKVIFCGLLLYFLASCGLLQRTTTTTNKDSQEFSRTANLTRAASQQKNMDAQSFTFYTDSTNHNYSVQLWPKGAFTYSPVDGFEGEAEKVLISGEVQGVKKGNGSTLSSTKETNLTELELKTSGKEKMAQIEVVKKAVPSAWWVFGSLMLLAALLIYFLRLKF